MPRKARNKTSTGIYHVMMRGINHQMIFEDAEDNQYFLGCLERMGFINDVDGTPIAQGCTYYAYYFNRKYKRSGHLFKERFRSEPVNDMEYFTTLLCYIHQNPVKAGIVDNVAEYAYSSWAEYSGEIYFQARICHVEAVLRRISFEELQELVCTPLPESLHVMDIEDEVTRHRLSDEQVKELIKIYSHCSNATEFQRLERSLQTEFIHIFRKKGASWRQLERLTGLSRGFLTRL